MKKIVVTLVMLLFLIITSNSVFAQISPWPAKKGEISVGLFCEGSQAIMRARDFPGADLNKLVNSGINVRYNITNNTAAKLAFGIYKLTIPYVFTDLSSNHEFSSNVRSFWEIGFNTTLLKSRKFNLMSFVQAVSYTRAEDSRLKILSGRPIRIIAADVVIKDHFGVDFGIMGIFTIKGISFYTGPFAYFKQSNVGIQVRSSDEIVSKNIIQRENGNIGGILGISLALGKKIAINTEFQRKSRNLFGVEISKKF